MKPTSATKKAKTLSAATYGRTARKVEGPGSIEDQCSLCQQYCASRGWEIVEPYSDAEKPGISLDRPALVRLLQDAERGQFDVLVVRDEERLSRDITQIKTVLSRLAHLRIAVHTLSYGEIKLVPIADRPPTSGDAC